MSVRRGSPVRRFSMILFVRPGLSVCFLCLLIVTALACKVPVFRYALERWDVDRYTMVVIVDGKPEIDTRRGIDRLREVSDSGAANVDIEIVDLAKLSPQELWQLEDFDSTVQTPHLQVFYPERNGRRKLCWEGGLTPAGLETWLVSPLRSEVIDGLVSGASAVWVLVEGADPEINQQTEDNLRAGIQQAMSEITIPDGVIPRLGANEYLQSHPEASLDDVLRCDIPLKVDFRVSRLTFDDQGEMALWEMGGGLATSKSGPWLIPIFGRGRMLDAIDGKGVTTETIVNACQYVVGECSCTVKTQNPGVDLLMLANWSESLGGDTVVIVDSRPELPPLLVDIPIGTPAIDASQSDASGPSWGLQTGLAIAVLMAAGIFGVWFGVRSGDR